MKKAFLLGAIALAFSVGVATIPAFAQQLGVMGQMPENGAGAFMDNMGHGMMGGAAMSHGMMGGSMMGNDYDGMTPSMNGDHPNSQRRAPQSQSPSIAD